MSSSPESFSYEPFGAVQGLPESSFTFSTNAGDDVSNDGEDPEEGNYAAQLKELLRDNESETVNSSGDDVEDEEDGGFLYTGIDAEEGSGGYQDQLREVLGTNYPEEDLTELVVEPPSVILPSGSSSPFERKSDQDFRSKVSPEASPPEQEEYAASVEYLPLTRPYLHPTVSRLRSCTPQSTFLRPSGSAGASYSPKLGGLSPPLSHLAALSRSSSPANAVGIGSLDTALDSSHPREVFKWTRLYRIETDLFKSTSPKASSLLGASLFGSPTVIASNGLICIGFDTGKVAIYDFKQELKCICGNDAMNVGPVTALALSHDHTFVVSGHATGSILLFDLKTPQAPSRTVGPTTLQAVSTGRKEGHIQGSRIINVGFVAGRHHAIVSSDEHGLAFYHSLGRVLFVEASDILRILGKYPDEELQAGVQTSSAARSLKNALAPGFTSIQRRKSKNTIIAMTPLPFGSSPNATDLYNLIALLTPTKLVMVGLKPRPRTWFKIPRDSGKLVKTASRRKGALSWFPCGSTSLVEKSQAPNLVYSWADTLHIVRVVEVRAKQPSRSSRTGKVDEVEVGGIYYEATATWVASSDILGLEWLNANQVVVLSTDALTVYDIRSKNPVEHVPFDAKTLTSPSLGLTSNGALQYPTSIAEVAHSFRTYKGKLFLLGRQDLKVGTLLTWAERILTFVQDGDFLGAIELSTSFYTGEAPGNRNGLPEDAEGRKAVIGEKIRELMVASARYTFSPDRLTDGTLATIGGQGVDQTSLFEGLVATCTRASIVLDDLNFLFEELFSLYDDHGIARIFLLQLEPFVLDNEIRQVPPRVTQRLVSLHESDNHPDLVERVIWHIDPGCLDINQAVHLCQKHLLYDALIYVYTRSLRDYVSPIVELLGLIRDIRRCRHSPVTNSTIELMILNAYKVFPYLASVLSGLSYPSDEPIPEAEGTLAKRDVYNFIFVGRTTSWPAGGNLILTAEMEGGLEPTFPYARLLLSFDAESFLHSLDVAFEDAYLTDSPGGMSRFVIIKILLDILSSGSLTASQATLVNIFVARNVPKYPQYIEVASSTLHTILISLSEDPDSKTREDRQLAAEYLLSVHNSHGCDQLVTLFEKAGFYRILRTEYRQDHRWTPLLWAYLNDTDIPPSEVLFYVGEVLEMSARYTKGSIPKDLVGSMPSALPSLFQSNITGTATLVEKYFPHLHDTALEMLEDRPLKQFEYLQHLLGPPQNQDVESPYFNSLGVSQDLRYKFICLQCRFYPDGVINVLKFIPPDLLDWPRVFEICDRFGSAEAVVWGLNATGYPSEALLKAETYERQLTTRIVDVFALSAEMSHDQATSMVDLTKILEKVGRMGIAICRERSQGSSTSEVPLEDIWYRLLSSQINSVQLISGCYSSPQPSVDVEHELTSESTHRQILSVTRSLVKETFAALVSVSSTHAVSFPRLFKRLVDSTAPTLQSTATQYTEFRTILTGMLESYRSDGDMLKITKHLVDRDLFEAIDTLARERVRGWTPTTMACSVCKSPLSKVKNLFVEDGQISVWRNDIKHHRCPQIGRD